MVPSRIARVIAAVTIASCLAGVDPSVKAQTAAKTDKKPEPTIT